MQTNTMNHVFRTIGFTLLLAVLISTANAQEKLEAADPMQEQFDELEKLLSNSVFEGHFTIDGQDFKPKKERYELRTVRKQNGDLWMIQARIKYGDHDVTVPLVLPVKWAGNTAVITVDNVSIPGLGTFDSRVLINNGKYSGTWQHGKVGGHLFGQVIPEGEEKDASKEPTNDKENVQPEPIEN